ncbi:putative phosphatase regulatory subunit-domain-containing protein [Lipomyces kononenkoae]
MPYTPPATSPVVSVSPSALQTHVNQHSQNQPPPTADLLPPALHPQNASSTVFYLHGPGGVPRSAAFLHKQPRSSPQKPFYYTQQNRRMFTASTVATANESASRDGLPAPPSSSPSSTANQTPAPSANKSSTKHAETSGVDADDEDDDSSANGSSTTSSPTSTDDDDDEDVDEMADNDDDAATIVAGRPSRRIKNLAALQEAVMNMPPQRRQTSPDRMPDPDALPPVIMSSKSMLDLRVTTKSTSSSVDDTDLDDYPPQRMVRKKSGELVKPSLKSRRPSSVPATPTYPKNVHFDTHLEHVRHFLQAERPAAVSNQASPSDEKEEDYFPWMPRSLRRRGDVDDDDESDSASDRSPSPSILYDWDLVLPNFPDHPNEHALVFVERVFLSTDQRSLLGHVAVKNIAFSKWVAAKFTVDYWKTVSEVAADFTDVLPGRSPRPPQGYDRFTFSIKLQDFSKLEHKTMFFCVRYNVNGQEYWDNNDGRNYQVEFTKSLKRGRQQPTFDYPMYDRYDRRRSDSAVDGIGYPSSTIGSIPASFLSSTIMSSSPPFGDPGVSSLNGLPGVAPGFTFGFHSNNNKPPKPDRLDYSFDSHYTIGSSSPASSPNSRGGLKTLAETQKSSSKVKPVRPPTRAPEIVPSGGRPFKSRYDFRESLNAVLTSTSPSSIESGSTDTVVASAPTERKGGFSFKSTGRYNVINNLSNSNSPNGSPHDTGSPMSDMPGVMKNGVGRGAGPSSEDLRHVDSQLAGMGLDPTDNAPGRIVQEKPAIDSTSYQVFLDNYCFFQGPQRAATSSAPSLSPVNPATVSSYTPAVPPINWHPKTVPQFYVGAMQSASPSPDNVSPFDSPGDVTPDTLSASVTSTPTAV